MLCSIFEVSAWKTSIRANSFFVATEDASKRRTIVAKKRRPKVLLDETLGWSFDTSKGGKENMDCLSTCRKIGVKGNDTSASSKCCVVGRTKHSAQNLYL